MQETPMIHKYIHNTFWLEGQISFSFEARIAGSKKDVVQSLNLRDFQDFLNDNGFELGLFSNKATHHPEQDLLSQRDLFATALSSEENFEDFPGMYLFPGKSLLDTPSAETTSVVSFFLLNETSSPQTTTTGTSPETVSISDMTSTEETSGSSYRRKEDRGTQRSTSTLSLVSRVVNLVNARLANLQKGEVLSNGKRLKPIPISAAAPNWLCGASAIPAGQIAEGCPLSPPIPLPAEAFCSSSPGRWPITLPDLQANLQSVAGDGVTVLVLDTLPRREQIISAAETAGKNNLLLRDVVNNVKFTYPELPTILDTHGPSQIKTGKDIYGRSVGFNMPDHGLFIAGIIRDIAPKSNVECIRVLNDFCVGSVQVLTDTLSKILERKLLGGDLAGKPVVINLSLVIPDDNEAKNAGIDVTTLDPTRQGLLTVIQSLIDLGVVFVASAGNEGDDRYEDHAVSIGPYRPNALYPAAFIYRGLNAIGADRMIPVGAVDKDGNATTYSCYPGSLGVASYGGNLPNLGTDLSTNENGMTVVSNVDGVIGIYTSPTYPALSVDDPQPTYNALDNHCWAYWIGTSFATPIISALAARALELHQSNVSTPQPSGIVRDAASQAVTWTNLSPADNPGSASSISDLGRVIKAVQCKADVDGDSNKVVTVMELDIIEVDEAGNVTEIDIVEVDTE